MNHRILFLGLILFPLIAASESFNYTIIADINGHDGEIIHLFEKGLRNRAASSTIHNGKIHIEGVAETNSEVELIIDRNNYAEFVLEKDTTVLDLEKHQAIKGGTINKRYVELIDFINDLPKLYAELRDSLNQIYPDKKEFADKFKLIWKKRFEEQKNFYLESIHSNGNNALGELALRFYSKSCDEKEWDKLYPTLSDYLKNLENTIESNRLFKAALNTSNGKFFTDFIGKDRNGEEIKFSDYIGKGRYVLVDFWASWCSPCRKIGKDILLPLYEKYKDDNRFCILGVAIADSRQPTIKAMENDGYKWNQIFDTGRKPAGIYGFNGIPHLMLFAPDGTIIERDLQPDEIEETISSILMAE